MATAGGEARKQWTAIVLTCQSKTGAHIYQKELEIHQNKGFLDKDVLLLTLEDPKARIGSGGATINALLVVTEHLSAKAGYETLTLSVLENANILIMHMGRDFPFSSCGRFFNTLPGKHTEESKEHLCDCIVSNFDLLLDVVSNKLSVNAPPGVWVCSTDMMLTVSPDTRINWKQFSDGIAMLLFHGDVEYAKDHGVVKLGDEGRVQDIIFRGTSDIIKTCTLENGKVPLVSGVVYINIPVAEKILSFHVYAPLDACTYYGLDTGAEPIQLSLFFDILLSLAGDVTESDFVCGERSGSYGHSTSMGTECSSKDEMALMRGARAKLWKILRGVSLKGVVIEKGEFDYMQPSAECYRRQMRGSITSSTTGPFELCVHTHVCFHKNNQGVTPNVDLSSVVVNSIIEGGVNVGKESVVSHCHLQGNLSFGSGSVLAGIAASDLKSLPPGTVLHDDLCILGYKVSLPGLRGESQRVLVVFGIHDELQIPASSPNSSYCNKPWKVLFGGTGINPEEVWIGVPEEQRSLYNAKLFPVVRPFDVLLEDAGKDDMLWLASTGVSDIPDRQVLNRWRSSLRLSLKDILNAVDMSAEFSWRKKLWFEIGKTEVEETLKNCESNCLVPFFKSCGKEGFAMQILEVLDEVASSATSPGVAARTLACIADVLGAMAGERAGLRSGPARNESWMYAFELLDKGEISLGIKALARERSKWLDRPHLLIRAARHYEGAEQVLRRRAVLTARQFFQTECCEPVPKGHWVIAEAPARIDLSGGWSDTPPITYEQGGAVLNVAVKLNGQKVTKAKVRKISKLEIVLVIHSGEHSVRVVCSELMHLENYTQPNAPGALLKACFCLLDIVTLPSSEKLSEQLNRKYQAGFELHTWSTAPQGSGLGTSSILAGVILAALLRVTDRTASMDSLIHAVMIVEQMLTTGGGWQDNVGGLIPGFKIARSQASLPLKVETEKVELSGKTVDEITKRLVCFYSGRTRLAKNLLQNVVRNWYARFSQITNNARNLINNAEEAAKALREGNIEKFGACWTCYRHQKALMAPGSEPKAIKDLLEAVEPLSYGQAMSGAGGGGFIFVLTKEPNMVDKVKAVIKKMKPSDETVAFYDVSVDWEGLTLRVEEPSQ
nr:L-fucose kinase-like [Pocillopora verrucosa]